MKKLLAMILCVAMVLSLAPAAFAVEPVIPAAPADVAKTAVEEAQAAIKDIYNNVAGDNAIVAAATVMDDSVTKFINVYLDLIDADEEEAEDIAAELRATIGEAIATEYAARVADDPTQVDVANAYADAVGAVLSNLSVYVPAFSTDAVLAALCEAIVAEYDVAYAAAWEIYDAATADVIAAVNEAYADAVPALAPFVAAE